MAVEATQGALQAPEPQKRQVQDLIDTLIDKKKKAKKDKDGKLMVYWSAKDLSELGWKSYEDKNYSKKSQSNFVYTYSSENLLIPSCE